VVSEYNKQKVAALVHQWAMNSIQAYPIHAHERYPKTLFSESSLY
jgi:hypothetical protein